MEMCPILRGRPISPSSRVTTLKNPVTTEREVHCETQKQKKSLCLLKSYEMGYIQGAGENQKEKEVEKGILILPLPTKKQWDNKTKRNQNL